MSFTVNTKIQPLIEDVGRIIPGVFLKSTEYKRWPVEHELDEVWSQIFNHIKSNRSFFAMGYDHDAADSKDALGYLLNIIYEQRQDRLPDFLLELLSFYAAELSEYVDASDIKKDLLAAGYSKEEIAVLDAITIPEQIEEKIEEELTQEQKVRALEKEYLSFRDENSHEAIDAYLEWHSAALLYLSNYYTEANADYSEFKHIDNSGNGHVLRHNYKSLYSIYNLLMNNVTTQDIAKTAANDKKTPLVFISHSHEDETFVVALVNLLEDMGFTKDTMFCSSVREYGIPLSGDIFETIRGLFLKHDLYVIFVHSPRFYSSAVSLNEMGAAWVLKTGFCSILTNDMEYGKMKGVVNNANISIKVNEKEAPSLLNDLYKHLSSIFSFQEMDMNKWERKRDQFLSVVRNLKYEEVKDSVEENSVDMEYKKLQIEKLKVEADARLKAVIRGNIVESRTKGNRILKIFNAGQAIAKNVNVEWLNPDDEVIVQWEFGLIGEISPQNGRSYNIALCMGHPDTMRLRYTWDDDYREKNVFEEDVQL